MDTELYNQLVNDINNSQIGSKTKIENQETLDKIQTFIDEYKKRDAKINNHDLTSLSIKEFINKMITASIDVINEISDIIQEKDVLSNADFRKRIVKSIFASDKRIYIGAWLIIISFILYFIDSAA